MRIVSCMGLALGLVFAALPDAGAETISLRADSWMPYNGDPDAERPGFGIEIVRAVFERAGYDVDYQTEGWTWDRSMEEGRKGSIDGIVGAAPSDAPDFVYPEEPIGVSQSVFHVKRGNDWKYDGMDSVRAVRLGVISGYSYEDEVDAYIEENQGSDRVQSISSDDALDLNIKKLLAGRIDVLVEDKLVFEAKAREMGVSAQMAMAGYLDEPDPVYVAFSPANPKSREYAEIVTKGIRELRASGALAEILARYDVEDWAP